MSRSMMRLLLTIFPPLLVAQGSAVTAGESAKLKSFLREYLSASFKAGDTTTRYYAAFVNLTGGGRRQVVVYFTDQHSCGTGGCTTLVLASAGSSYKLITSITIGWPPIRVLSTSSNGWHDLGIWVQGGGIQPGYEAILRFDGETYPRNPSVPPAEPLSEKVTGQVVIPKNANGTPLWGNTE